MPLPTFIIVGAPKCGTTALWSYLDEHPEVEMSRLKEPHFFTELQHDFGNGVGKPGPLRSITYRNGIEWYAGLFGAKPLARARGEASTHYFSAPDSAALIRRHLPDVRLIFMVRDPVDRLYSHFWQDRKQGVELPDFATLVRTDHPAFRYYAYVSEYETHFTRFLSLFPRDRILVLTDAELRTETAAVLRRVCEFIGVSPDFRPASLGSQFNPHTEPRYRWITRAVLALRFNRVTHAMPMRIRRRLGTIRALVSRLNSRRSQYSPMPPDLRALLQARFAPRAAFAARLTAGPVSERPLAAS